MKPNSPTPDLINGGTKSPPSFPFIKGKLRGIWARLSLVARLMLSASLALAVAGALLLWVSTGRDADFARTQIEGHLAENMESLLDAISEWAVIGDYANIEQVLRLRVKHADIQRITWTNTRGTTLEADDKAITPHASGWFVRWIGVPSPQASRALVLGGRDYGQVTIAMTATPAQNRLWDAFLGRLAILALALGLDFVGILLILKNGLRPLAALDQGARALESGEMSARIPPQGSPELVHVINAFNRMADALEAAQDAMSQETERLAVTLSSIGDGVLVTDLEGRVTFMNPLAEALTGWQTDQALGHSVLEVFHIINETSRHEVDCPVGRAIREGVVVGLANPTLLIARDGTERPIADSAAPIRHPDGHITGAVLVFRDQTEERRTLSRLALAASVFENSLNGGIVTDSGQRIIEVNPAFTRTTGYSRAEVLGQTPRLLSSGRQAAGFYATMWAEIQTTGQWRGEIWNRRKDGEIFPEEVSVVALKDEEGAVIHYIGSFSDISQIKAQEAQLQHLAHYDPLTGLPNRALLADRLKVAMAQAKRSGEKLAVCYLDLDGFKPVNDSCGHATGDLLLVEVAGRLSDAVRGGDTVARMGGDEFVFLLANLADVEKYEIVLSRMLQSVAQPIVIDGTALTVTASIGITLFPDDEVDADTLLRHADQALYAAKQAGRNRFVCFDVEQDTDTAAHYDMLVRLRHALHAGELALHYQPKVNMRSGQVVGFEALLRWMHPRDGLVLPLAFLPLVEESDLIIEIGEWVIEQALVQLASWAAAGHVWPVSVNIAVRHFHQDDFVQRLQALLTRYPSVAPQWLDLEVLESVAMRNIQQVQRTIEACQALGVSFSLDDFGTGYSSLSYLKHLPTETLKIDRAFIRDILDDRDDLALTEAIITLSNVFNRQVVAEGVELAEQGVLLMRLGCDVAQGFGIAKPMPASDVEGWVKQFVPDPTWGIWADVPWELSDFPLLVAQHDHLQWVKRVVMAVEGGNLRLTAAQLTDHHACRFGHWYDGYGKARYGHLSEYVALDSVHQKVHEIGPEILRLRDTGQLTQARAACSELLVLKDCILKLLDSLGSAILAKSAG